MREQMTSKTALGCRESDVTTQTTLGFCKTCSLRTSKFFGLLLARYTCPSDLAMEYRSCLARQNIVHAGQPSEGVMVLCSGWAVRFVQLPNGKRQALSVALPGDLVSAASVVEERHGYSLQAVTNVGYCFFQARALRDKIRHDPVLLDAWAALMAAQVRDLEASLVDLGQRSAEERIAALLLRLFERCQQGGAATGFRFPFPLRQQHIADLAGLTPVHTCRVLQALRTKNICEIANGVATIADFAKLKQLADVRQQDSQCAA